MGDTSFDKDRCPLECVAKDCPTGSDTTEKAAVAGFSVVVTTGYSGDTKCTKVNSCPDGSAYSLKFVPIGEKLGTQIVAFISNGSSFKPCYKIECTEDISSVDDCGKTGSDGWTLGESMLIGCNICLQKSCPDGSSTEQAGDCYLHEITGYSGNQICYSEEQGKYCPYDCSNVGGMVCSSSETYRGQICLRCRLLDV